ncbi:hypothetical protein BGZ46_005045 [Entomortierella lignicola]|nr:hypothetical protein BGZ46_005045 [Entomortierella lignicola]
MSTVLAAAAASSMRRVLSVGSNTSTTAATSFLKNNTLHSLRLSHSSFPSPLATKSYRISHFSTTPDNIASQTAAYDESSTLESNPLAAEDTLSSEEEQEGKGEEGPRKDVLQYRKPKFTPEIDQEILRLQAQGHSWMVIGTTLGIPYRSCHRRFISILDPNLHLSWTDEKVSQMDSLVAEGKTWSEIAQILGISATNCQNKWKGIVRPEGVDRNRQFDALQSKLILSLVKEYGEGDWKKIMREFMRQLGGRDMAKVTPEQLRHQYIRLQRRTTEVWSLDEETVLIQHVLKHGADKWELISETFKNNHSPEKCKEKWLQLDMKREVPKERAFYKAERGIFWRLYLRYGDDWKEIASQLKKRTPATCENFFNKQTEGFKKDNPEEFANQVKELAEKSISYNSVHWKKEDSELLVEMVNRVTSKSKSGRVDWKKVTELMSQKMNLDGEQYKHHFYYLQLVEKRGGISGRWTEEEMRTLEKAVQEVGRNWALISSKYLPHRNPKSLCHKFIKINVKGAYISPEEYETLLSNVDKQEEAFYKKHGSDSEDSSAVKFKPNWKSIAKVMPGGTWTAEQCRSAYESSFKNHLKNVKWTPEEDEALKENVRKYGRKNWIGIALRIPGKDNWECRLRWAELQDPELKDKMNPVVTEEVEKEDSLN